MFLALSLISCATTPRSVQIGSVFDPAEAAFINQTGSARISGQAFLMTRGGDVKYASGNSVYLIPVTRYSTERFEAIYGLSDCTVQNVNVGTTDPKYMKMMRHTQADGQGRFSFDSLAAGEYFVTTHVMWEAPSGSGLTPQGCSLKKRATVGNGQELDIVLTSR